MILDYVVNNGLEVEPYEDSGIAGGFMSASIVLWIILLIFNVFQIIGMWRLFKRFDKPGWAAIIPLYNFYVMCEITNLPKYYVALLIIPIANIYALYKIYDALVKKLEKPNWFTFGLLFLPYIFIPIVGFNINFSKKDKISEEKTEEQESSEISEASKIISEEDEYVAPTFDSDFDTVNLNQNNNVNNFENSFQNINSDIFSNNINSFEQFQPNQNFSNVNEAVNRVSEPDNSSNTEPSNELPSVGEVVNSASEETASNTEPSNELPSIGEVVNSASEETTSNTEPSNELPSVGEVVNSASEETTSNTKMENSLQNNNTELNSSINQVDTPGATNPFIDNLIEQNVAKKQTESVTNDEHKELKDFGMENNLSKDNPFSPKPDNENIVSEEYF